MGLTLLLTLVAAQDDFVPLKSGSRWTYTFHAQGEQKEFVQSITGTERVNGIECFVLESEVAGQREKMWLRQTAEGVWLHRAQSRDVASDLQKPALILKYPLQADSSGWSARIPAGTVSVEYHFVNEGESEVQVHGRKYRAWKIRARGRMERLEFEVTYWYVKGVGLVKQVMSGPHGETRCELKEFK